MKRIFSLLLVLCMLAAMPAVYADEDIPMHVTIGSLTKTDGNFFTAQFGNNTTDIDIRRVLHGYNPIVWSTQLDFIADPMVVEGLTESIDAKGDTVYTVKLHEDLCWNDGSEITAADYVFSYLLQAAPQFAEIGADIDVWHHIRGWDEYAAGDTDCLKGVRLLDRYTFSVTVKAEFEINFYDLSMIFSCPYPIDVLAPGCKVVDSSDGARITAIEDGAESPFTAELLRKTVLDNRSGYLSHPGKVCGSYSLKSYNANSGTVEFVINEYFKGHEEDLNKEIRTITLVFVRENEAVSMLDKGKVDIINKVVSLDTIRGVEALERSDIDRSVYDRLGYGLITFACEKDILLSENVRRAIACVLDTEAFAEEYLGEYGEAVYGYYGIGQWMYKAAAGSLRPESMKPGEAELWDAQNLSGLDRYSFDIGRAVALIEQDGWVLNSAGKEFNPTRDRIRYKDVDGKLVPLSFRFGLIANNAGAKRIADLLQDGLKQLGAGMSIQTADFKTILADFFTENGTRKYDMSFLASNFAAQFDCVTDFWFDDNGPGTQNLSKIEDKELLARAWDMHKTAPGDTLGYLTKWVRFQERFNEILPTLPVYSNRYVDFYIDRVHNYNPEAVRGWPEAILDASIDMQ